MAHATTYLSKCGKGISVSDGNYMLKLASYLDNYNCAKIGTGTGAADPPLASFATTPIIDDGNSTISIGEENEQGADPSSSTTSGNNVPNLMILYIVIPIAAFAIIVVVVVVVIVVKKRAAENAGGQYEQEQDEEEQE